MQWQSVCKLGKNMQYARIQKTFSGKGVSDGLLRLQGEGVQGKFTMWILKKIVKGAQTPPPPQLDPFSKSAHACASNHHNDPDKASFYPFSGNLSVYKLHITIKKHVNMHAYLDLHVTVFYLLNSWFNGNFSGNNSQTVMFDIWYFQRWLIRRLVFHSKVYSTLKKKVCYSVYRTLNILIFANFKLQIIIIIQIPGWPNFLLLH